jgi:hypothetical protein
MLAAMGSNCGNLSNHMKYHDFKEIKRCSRFMLYVKEPASNEIQWWRDRVLERDLKLC